MNKQASKKTQIQPLPYLIQGDSITVVVWSKPHSIHRTHISFQQIKTAIRDGEWDKVVELVDPKKTVLKYGQGRVAIQGEKLFLDGRELHNSLTVKIIQMFQEGFPIEPMIKFMENLMLNPSHRAVTELYDFLERGNLPITPDGHFLAFKYVRQDYRDVHSGTFDNSVGAIPEMPRNEVDDNSNNTCSRGLHFCSREYLKQYGSGNRIMIVKVNPRDVVSIPTDYNHSKARSCRYEVVAELEGDADQALVSAVEYMGYSKKKPERARKNTKKAGARRGPDGRYISRSR